MSFGVSLSAYREIASIVANNVADVKVYRVVGYTNHKEVRDESSG